MSQPGIFRHPPQPYQLPPFAENIPPVTGIVGGAGIPSRQAFGVGGAIAVAPNIVGTVGIPSQQAFGAGGIIALANAAQNITGNYGIPSRQAFGNGVVWERTDNGAVVFLNGIDISNFVRENPALDIQNIFAQISTAQFEIWDQNSTLTPPVVGQDVKIFQKGTLIFGGTIEEIIQYAYQATSSKIWTVKCTDYSQRLDIRVVGRYYTTSFGDFISIVQDVVNNALAIDGITYDHSNGEPSFNLGSLLFDWVTVRDAFNQLSSLTGWDFLVDFHKVLRFFAPFPVGNGIAVAPFNLADNNGKWLAETMKVRTFRGKYRNRQIVKSSTQSSGLWTDIFSAAMPGPYPSSPQAPDGIRTAFITLYGISSTPAVNVNGFSQRVISLNDVAGAPANSYDWYWIPQQGLPEPSKGIFQNQNNTPLKSTDVLTVSYQTSLSPAFVVTCNAQVTARAAIEGGSGLYESVQQVSGITDPSAIAAYANGLLNRYGCNAGIPIEITYETDSNLGGDGLIAGMTQVVNVSNPLVPNTRYLVTKVEIREVNKTYLKYTVTLDSGNAGYQGVNFEAYFAALAQMAQLAQPANQQSYVWQLAPSIPGVNNTNVVLGGIYPTLYTVQHSAEIPQYLEVIFKSVGNTNTPQGILLLVNGGGLGQSIHVLKAGQTYRVYFTGGAQPVLHRGDSLQLLLGDGSVGYLDGTATFVTSVSVD